MSDSNASPVVGSGIGQDQPEQRDPTIPVPAARATSPSPSSPAASHLHSSTSTQWPSATSSPNSQAQQDVNHLQDILDRALHDPFSTHPDVTAHLKSNIEKHCKQAAQKIYDADVLLVVTGAGFSADSGLATYIDVADIDAYRSRGWRYRDLCKPPTFTDFSRLDTDGNKDNMADSGGDANALVAEMLEDTQNESPGSCNNMEVDDRGSKSDSNSENNSESSKDDRGHQELFSSALPDEDDINHPQYFYGFWGQCCNDYRRVKPHEGYDIISQWGRDKNNGPKKCVDMEHVSGNNGNLKAPSKNYEEKASIAAKAIRRITLKLEQGNGNDSDSDSSDSSESFHFKEEEEEEPYYVSPDKRAGAFFVFTSNVDAHSFDVFESHEIRECHGNVEMWQCHNFGCGTNASNGGLLDRINDDDAGDGNVDDVRQQQPCKWKRRLWRLPTDHSFFVDRSTMSAPQTKTVKNESVGAKNVLAAAASASPPASKRRKSSIYDDKNNNDADRNDDYATNHNNVNVSEALGSMMEDTLRNHLEKKGSENKSCVNASKGSNLPPAHVGDVHGKPRLHPLRHMHPPLPEPASDKVEIQSQNYFLPISGDENWPKCPRCQEAARPAVLMFDDLDWVYNLKQDQRWQRWCQALMKLCKQYSRVGVDGSLGSDSASTVSGTNISEKGWEDVSEATPEQMTDQKLNVPPSQSKFSFQCQSPLKVAILEIGCGYNVPTCRLIAERLVSELSMRGGDATLIRINLSHPEPDDHSVEDFVISIMEKGLTALKIIQEEYARIKEEHDDGK